MLTEFIICAVIFMVSYLLLDEYRRHKGLPPGPPAYPIIGNTILFKKNPKGYKELTRLADEYGNVYRLLCGSTVIILINGYDAIHEFFVKKADIFTDRPQLFVPLVGVSKGTGLTYNSDKPWKTLRRFTLQALRDFGVGKKSLEDKIHEEIAVIEEIIKRSNGDGIRMKPYLLSAATNIICSVMFGERFNYDDSRFTQLTNVLEEIFRLNAPFAKENFFPITRWLPSGKQLIRKRRAAVEKVKRYLAESIEEHKKSFDPDSVRDFIDLYLKGSSDKDNSEIFTESNIYKIIVDLFLAGGETTGTSLDWCLLYMITHPDVQTRCQTEIDAIIGHSRPVSLSDRGKMKFVEATLLEIQRIANTLTFSLPHVANKESTVYGHRIPKDAIIIANLYSAHIDTKYWEEPEEFLPERFLGDDGNIIRKDAFVPFSAGPRFCIGEPLARMELFLFFTNLLQKFRFQKVDDNDNPSLDGIQALTLTPLPYKLSATLR